MEALRTLIIDDETQVRNLLADLLNTYCPKAHIVGTADSVQNGVKAIAEHNPDLVLLDVNLGDGTAFDLLQQLPETNFALIFVTAYENYALQAFRASALDYLLKPIHVEALQEAIEKAYQQRNAHQLTDQLSQQLSGQLSQQLKSYLDNLNGKPDDKKIVLKTQDSLYVVRIQDIIRCEAEHNYTTLYLHNGNRIVVSRTLKEYETLLVDHRFFRAHQSHLVNINYIHCFDKREGGLLRMEDGSTVPVSQRKREELAELFNQF